MRYKSNEQNVCPVCNHAEDLEYEGLEVEGDYVYYPWSCSHCDSEGEEWYKLDFVGHNVRNEEGDYEEVPDSLKESEPTVPPEESKSESKSDTVDTEKNTVTIVNALCTHNITTPCDKYGKVYHVVMFTSPASGKSYSWVTSSGGLDYTEGKTYNIKAKYIPDGTNNKLQYVKKMTQSEVSKVKSEHDHVALDMYDVMIGKVKLGYILDNNLKILYNGRK